MQNWVWISLLLAMILSMVVCAQREEQHAANPLQRQNRAIITLGELLERTMWPEEIRTVKTRRAPSGGDNYQWESMMQSLDNLRKPRFG